jgi:predicted O-methyltransferase YrrM
MGKAWRQRAIAVAARAIDIPLAPFAAASAAILKMARAVGIGRLPVTRGALNRIGVYPILDHYYEPLFNPRRLRYPLDAIRPLPGIDWNIDGQLALLDQFRYQDELRAFPLEAGPGLEFYYHNRSFESGDAEYLYSIIRTIRPRRIIEIGSGHSSRLALAALRRNSAENPSSAGELLCIEPFESPWLEQLGVTVCRTPVEQVEPERFTTLERDDILFIDSSHMIRPQGDVLCEFLEILPRLKPGVVVHLHDIFTPRDYPPHWIARDVHMYNEQYLLEMLLSSGRGFEIIGAVNLLAHAYPEALAAKLPIWAAERAVREPGSFWMRKIA